MGKKGTEPQGPMAMLLKMTMMHAQMDIEKGKGKFLSDSDAGKFLLSALWPIKDQLTRAFSTPTHFFSHGLSFKLSDYHPEGILAETAHKIGLKITLCDVPPKYYVSIAVDKELTAKNSELTFSLTERSDGVDFSKISFTIKELEEEFASNM